MEGQSETTVIRTRLRSTRQFGSVRPPGRKATEALSEYLLVEVFARRFQRAAPEAAVTWAAADLRQIQGA